MKVEDLGLRAYQQVVDDMQAYTQQRDDTSEDKLWLLEHEPVFTQGLNGDPSHILNASDIPVVNTDRGGQVTYHGPGQLVAYTLIDLRRAKVGVREMVSRLEQTVIGILAEFDIAAKARKDAPGVYVNESKIASLGLRVKRGACYHGVSFNIDMDLTPFSYINPCGYAGMEVIDLKSLGVNLSMAEAKQRFVNAFMQQMLAG
ncbi:MAG TPA: lipoyl(octanoyl) transferase LipB [Methylophaga aminisulfidivorans]|uniref:Octanoyltransferase n=1 Tax=Methylophaga aminisulfidivorans TaxID=230105 RepID=A0A7C2AG83_9GAMM|nr:lipoyl(octanoyl) transferase LipB [Methylophaga aminisulfidivorans]